MAGQSELSVIVPVFNEAAGIGGFHTALSRVLDTLDIAASVWYVDDGSSDGTLEILTRIAEAEPRVRVVELSRNFGHQSALSAGLDLAGGDILIVMDGDGQHPPALIPALLERHRQGFDIVLTARENTRGSSWFKRATSRLFYGVINRLSEIRVESGAADFRLMSRPAAKALMSLRESHRFLRGMVSWIGFRQTSISYEAPARAAGRSKYTFGRMLRFASDALFSFSRVPLRFCYVLGALLILLSLVEGAWTAWLYFSPRRSTLAPGWSSLMFFVLFGGGLQLLTLGIIAHYIGYIYDEVKRRPLYLVRKLHGQAETPEA